MNTLWAFGVSHTKGMSLQEDFSISDLENWYQNNLGCNTWMEMYKKFNGKQKRLDWLIRKKWNKIENPHLSYAGRFAKIRKMKYNNLAKSGTGIDSCFQQLERVENDIDWKNDIVLMEIPPVYRYMTLDDEVLFQFDLDSSINYREYILSLDSTRYLYRGIATMITQKYPDIKFIDIMSDRTKDVEHQINLTPINTQSLSDLNDELDYPIYPTGHFWYETHIKFAQKLNSIIS